MTSDTHCSEEGHESLPATRQCPKCKDYYCDYCVDAFLPLDNENWTLDKLICPYCHYKLYGKLKWHFDPDWRSKL